MTPDKILTDAMRRIQGGEKLTYTDKEVELIMLGWQSELDKANAARIEAQTENEALKAKLAKSGLDKWRAVREAVAEERMVCAELMEQQHTWITNVAASALIRARGTP